MSLGTVLVTGGSSGLGAAVVKAVIKRGGVPVVLDMQAPESDEVDFEQLDLADSVATAAAVGRVVERFPELNALVTAAGIDRCGRLLDVPAAEWERVVAVNLLGTVSVVRAALPALRRNHGKVVTVASTLGLRVFSDATAYCASKFAVVGFTRALTAELQGEVGVTLLIPGGMHTHFFDDRDAQYQPAPDAVLNSPDNVAEVVITALSQPPGCELREVIVTAATEGSWP